MARRTLSTCNGSIDNRGYKFAARWSASGPSYRPNRGRPTPPVLSTIDGAISVWAASGREFHYLYGGVIVDNNINSPVHRSRDENPTVTHKLLRAVLVRYERGSQNETVGGRMVVKTSAETHYPNVTNPYTPYGGSVTMVIIIRHIVDREMFQSYERSQESRTSPSAADTTIHTATSPYRAVSTATTVRRICRTSTRPAGARLADCCSTRTRPYRP